MRELLHFLAPYLGAFGSFLFAVVNVPIIVKIWCQKSTDGSSLLFVIMSFVANICCGLFVLDNNLTTGVWQYALYANYGFAFVCCCVLLYLFWKFRKK
jgi:hypothetical protein